MTNPYPLCPLCGSDVSCGVASGASTCWCFAEAFPAELLALVPPTQQGQACVCAPCLRAAASLLAAGTAPLTLPDLLARRRGDS